MAGRWSKLLGSCGLQAVSFSAYKMVFVKQFSVSPPSPRKKKHSEIQGAPVLLQAWSLAGAQHPVWELGASVT